MVRTASAGMLRSTSLATTSERFTALIATRGKAAATVALPGSLFKSARSAEASRTTSLIPGLPPAFRDQVIREAAALRDVGADRGLGTPDGLVRRQDPDRPLFEEQ